MSIDLAEALPTSALDAEQTGPARANTAPTNTDIAAFFTYLIRSCDWLSPKVTGPDTYACIMPLLFTHAIITGRIGDRSGYEDRWCYSSLEKAEAAFDAWDGRGEPEGWHRHPITGRRRIEGDPATEYIDP